MKKEDGKEHDMENRRDDTRPLQTQTRPHNKPQPKTGNQKPLEP